jgi:6-phosphogluconolactonase
VLRRHRPCETVVFVAHYHGGAVALLELDDTGRANKVLGLIRPPATVGGGDRSAVPPRPHAVLPLGESEVLITDTGRDRVLLYRLATQGTQTRLELLDGLALPAGTGPRHLARSPREGIVYISNQNSGGVSIVERVARDEGPHLVLRAVLKSLGGAVSVPSEVAVHPAWNTCYLANRTGGLHPCGAVDVMGRNPRHFALAPGGEWLVAANQDSDEVTIFHIEDNGRRLVWTGERAAVASPTVVAF